MAEESIDHNAPVAVWVAVVVIIAGTIIGGIALIEWNWPVFWVGIGLFVVGSIGAMLAGIMDAVDEFVPPTPADAETAA